MPVNPKCGKSRRGFTFAGPHRETTIAELIGMEVEQHREIVETL